MNVLDWAMLSRSRGAIHQNSAVVRELLEQASARNFDAIPRLVTEDYVLQPEGIRGADELAEMVQGYRDQIRT